MEIIGIVETKAETTKGRLTFSLRREDNGQIASCISAVGLKPAKPIVGDRVALMGEQVAGSNGAPATFGFDYLEVMKKRP